MGPHTCQGNGALLQLLLRFTPFIQHVEVAAAHLPASSAAAVRSLIADAQNESRARGGGGGGGAGGNEASVSVEERHAARNIAEMLPGVGEGFLVAVLRHYGEPPPHPSPG
jgi:hypothetical protein